MTNSTNSTATVVNRTMYSTHSLGYNTHPLIPSVTADQFMGTLLLLTSFFGTLANCLAIVYFTRQRREISNIIYMCIVGVDIMNSLLMFSPGVSYFMSRHPFLLDNSWICDMWGVLFHVTSRLSVFLVAALSLSRTISLTFPFYRLKKRHVLVPMGIYILLLIGPALFPFYYHSRYM